MVTCVLIIMAKNTKNIIKNKNMKKTILIILIPTTIIVYLAFFMERPIVDCEEIIGFEGVCPGISVEQLEVIRPSLEFDDFGFFEDEIINEYFTEVMYVYDGYFGEEFMSGGRGKDLMKIYLIYSSDFEGFNENIDEARTYFVDVYGENYQEGYAIHETNDMELQFPIYYWGKDDYQVIFRYYFDENDEYPFVGNGWVLTIAYDFYGIEELVYSEVFFE